MGGFFSTLPDVDMDGPEAELVREIIHEKCVVVFSKTHCPYCRMAKQTLDSLNAHYETVELDKRGDGDKIQAVLGKMTGASTVSKLLKLGNQQNKPKIWAPF